MPSSTFKHCQTLGISEYASDTEIRTTYRKLALKWHPDKCKKKGDAKAVKEATGKFQEIQNAYAHLQERDYSCEDDLDRRDESNHDNKENEFRGGGEKRYYHDYRYRAPSPPPAPKTPKKKPKTPPPPPPPKAPPISNRQKKRNAAAKKAAADREKRRANGEEFDTDEEEKEEKKKRADEDMKAKLSAEKEKQEKQQKKEKKAAAAATSKAKNAKKEMEKKQATAAAAAADAAKAKAKAKKDALIAPASAVPLQAWSCTECTFLNHPCVEYCTMCTTAKLFSEYPKKEDFEKSEGEEAEDFVKRAMGEKEAQLKVEQQARTKMEAKRKACELEKEKKQEPRTKIEVKRKARQLEKEKKYEARTKIEVKRKARDLEKKKKHEAYLKVEQEAHMRSALLLKFCTECLVMYAVVLLVLTLVALVFFVIDVADYFARALFLSGILPWFVLLLIAHFLSETKK